MPQDSRKKTIFWLFWTISPTRMGLSIWLGAHLHAKTLGHTPHPLAGFCVPFWSIWGCQNAPKQHEKTIFWMFWTISPTRMALLIWLQAYLQATILGHLRAFLGMSPEGGEALSSHHITFFPSICDEMRGFAPFRANAPSKPSYHPFY
jgi:hypothetical protein